MKNNCYSIEKRLRLRLSLLLSLYTVIGFVIMLLSDYVLALFPSPISAWILERLDVIFALYLIFGFVGIFYFYWKKPWEYLNEVIGATEIVYEQNDHTIELSEPLREVESKMNQIKMSVLLSQQAAKEAETKKNELVMYLAHDIRTPLTTVIGYLSLLNEAPDMPEEQKEKYIGIALDKSERLETLINELFEITRYHTNTVQVTTEQAYWINYFYDIDFIGDGGVGISSSVKSWAERCSFTGWKTGVLGYGTAWVNIIDCLFEDNEVGFHFNSTGQSASHSLYNDNRFRHNGIAVLLEQVPTDMALDFVGSEFMENETDVDNRCGHSVDLSQAVFPARQDTWEQ